MTYKVQREKMEDIIDNATFDRFDSNRNDTFKSVLKILTGELCNYNEKVMRNIERQTLNVREQHVLDEVVCALIPRRDIGRLYQESEMCQLSKTSGIYFIDADYDVMREIVGDNLSEKVYEGSYYANGQMEKFHYKFVFEDCFLEAQDLLFRLSQHYKVSNGILFSPFMRKSFRIELLEDISTEEKEPELDYQFERNQIPVVKDSALLWNLRTVNTEVISATKKKPYGADIKYGYRFEKSESGNYYYVLPKNNQTLIYDIKFIEEGTELWLDHELEAFLLIESTSVDWEKLEIKKLKSADRIFSNRLLRNELMNRRIISKGDVEYSIRPFRNNEGVQCKIASELEHVCIRYSSKYRNHFSNRVGYRKLKREYLKFSSKQNVKFLVDYINYVLLYMEYYYPEIEWVGGR